MYAATTKGEGNAADRRFSTACEDMTVLDSISLLKNRKSFYEDLA
jgi:hypothetical protein